MTITYKKNKLEKQLCNASEIKKNFGVNAKRVASRLDDIASSPTLAVLKRIPAANCHALSGERAGQWALDVSANFRMIFEIADDPIPTTESGVPDPNAVTSICIIEIANYH
jgi:plasmid maintenance system killer protein